MWLPQGKPGGGALDATEAGGAAELAALATLATSAGAPLDRAAAAVADGTVDGPGDAESDSLRAFTVTTAGAASAFVELSEAERAQERVHTDVTERRIANRCIVHPTCYRYAERPLSRPGLRALALARLSARSE